MTSIICTLFEGHYHYGVAALINSLYKEGFRGHIFLGFKGNLPKWAKDRKENRSFNNKIVYTLEVAKDLQLHFIEIMADYHLTNYKPNFMLEVWDLSVNKNVDALFYFDPDIVVKIKWTYFEEWVGYGVTLVHDLSYNNMPPSHPKRMTWKNVLNKVGRETKNQLNSYINAGFCGVKIKDKEFLSLWKEIFQVGNSFFNLSNNQWQHDLPPNHMFFKQDQDALNIAAMCSPFSLSEMGPEAMDFIPNGYVMSHSVDKPKPWKKNFFLEFLKGNQASITDRLFWENVSFPVKPYNRLRIINKKFSIKATSFLSRFYKK